MKYKINKEDCLLKDLKIPIGNMLTFSEVAKIVETEEPKEIYQLLKERCIWINFKGKIRWVGLIYAVGVFHIISYDFNYQGRSRGVYVDRNPKQVK